MSERGQEDDVTDRRSVLQGIGAVGAGTIGTGATGFLAGTGTAAAAASCRIPSGSESEDEESYRRKEADADYYEFQDGSYRYDRLTDLQSSVIYQGATYSDVEDQWIHFFRTGGYSKTMRKLSYESKSEYSFYPGHDYVKTTLTNNDTSIAALYTTNNSREVGITPPPSSDGDPNYGAAAFTLMTAVLGTNPYVGAAITAAQIIAALTYTEKSGNGSEVEYKWNYDFDNEKCETAHFINFDMKSAKGEETASVSVENVVTYGGYGGVKINYDLFVDAVPNNLQTVEAAAATGDAAVGAANVPRDAPEPGDPEYTGWLVENGFATKVANEDIEREEVKEIAQGGPVFHATEPAVQADSQTSTFEE